MKKGFSLVELIISIILITAISVASLFIYLKNKEDNETVTAMKELEEITNIFYSDNFSNGDYKYYKNDEGSTVSCMKLETLVNEGLVDSDSPLLKTYGLDNIFKYIVNSEGFVSIEPVIDATDKTCEYISMEEGTFNPVNVPNNDYSIPSDKGKAWDVNYGYSVDKVEGETNQFKGDITFEMNLKQVISVENINPLYIVVIMDRSGSMSGTPYTNAKNAVTSMITAFKGMDAKVKNKIKIGSVYYGSSATQGASFKSLSSLSTYSDLGFPTSASGGTDCAAGLTKAKTLFDSVSVSGAVKIGIFLSDGECNSTSSAKTKATTLKNSDVQMFTIAYGTWVDKTTLKAMASSSKSCDTENHETETKCFFESDTSKISSTFKDLAISSVDASIDNPYNKVTFSIKLPTYFEFVGPINTSKVYKSGYNYQDQLLSNENTLKRTVTITNTSSVSVLDITDFDYKIKFLADKYKEEKSDELVVGTSEEKPLDVIEKLLIEMTGTGVSSKSIPIEDNLPKITINLSNNSVVN